MRILLLLLLSFTATAQSQYPNRAYNFAMVDSNERGETMLYTVSMDSARAALGILAASPANTTSPVRTFNVNFQPSATRACLVRYSIQIDASSAKAGIVILEYSANGTTGWVEAGRTANDDVNATGQITGLIPPGYYARLATSGTATITYLSGQETIL